MPEQLMTRCPVQMREFVPTPAAQTTYRGRAQVFTRVRVLERGPDVQVEVYTGDLRVGVLAIPREAESEVVCRLFGEVPERREDRAAFQVTLQALEDAAVSGNAAQLITAWRRAFEVYDTLSRDLATLAGLPQQDRSGGQAA